MLEARLIVRDSEDGYVFIDMTRSYDGLPRKRPDALLELLTGLSSSAVGEMQRIGATMTLQRRTDD